MLLIDSDTTFAATNRAATNCTIPDKAANFTRTVTGRTTSGGGNKFEHNEKLVAYMIAERPVNASNHFSQKPLEVNKGRSPSPVDLCTTKPPEDKNEKKSPEKKPADKLKKLCTFSEDPREVLRYIPKATAAQLKLAPAHHAVEMSMHSPKPGDAIPIFTPTPPADLTKKSDDATKKSDDTTKKSDDTTKKVTMQPRKVTTMMQPRKVTKQPRKVTTQSQVRMWSRHLQMGQACDR